MSALRITVIATLALTGCGRLNFHPLDAAMDARASTVDVLTPDAAIDAFTPDANLDAFAPDAFTSDVGNDGGGARPNYAFVTSGRFTGALGGVAGADTKCRVEAAAAGLTGEFFAMIRGAERPNPAALLASSRGWVMRDGRWVADLAEQVADGSFFHPLYAYADGTRVDSMDDGFRVWTGDDGENCAEWTSASGTGDQHWIPQWRRLSDGGLDCAMTYRLFCFERGHNVIVSAPPSTLPRIFVSRGLWAPNVRGITSADQFCNAEALTAGIATAGGPSFRALLPFGGESAQARTGNRAYRRIDSIVVGAPGLEETQETYVILDAAGATPADTNGIWTGGNPNVPSTATCGDWQLSSGSGEQGGASDWTGFEGSTELCSTALHLYCVES